MHDAACNVLKCLLQYPSRPSYEGFHDATILESPHLNVATVRNGQTAYVASHWFSIDGGSLTYLNQYTTGENVSWTISHPTNKSML